MFLYFEEMKHLNLFLLYLLLFSAVRPFTVPTFGAIQLYMSKRHNSSIVII
jgi:hypothetical protein